GQLSERGEIPFAKEVVERLFDLLNAVNLALPQASAQCVDRDVDVDNFVRAAQEAIRNRLLDAHARDARHDIVQRFEVLDVDGGDDGNADVENFEHVLITFMV